MMHRRGTGAPCDPRPSGPDTRLQGAFLSAAVLAGDRERAPVIGTEFHPGTACLPAAERAPLQLPLPPEERDDRNEQEEEEEWESEMQEEQGDGQGSGEQEQAQLPCLRAATSMTA